MPLGLPKPSPMQDEGIVSRRRSHLKKRAGRNPGEEKMAEHLRVEALFADGEVGSGGTSGAGLVVAGEHSQSAGTYFPAHEQADKESAPGE